jgi:hypothetical protein
MARHHAARLALRNRRTADTRDEAEKKFREQMERFAKIPADLLHGQKENARQDKASEALKKAAAIADDGSRSCSPL